MGRGRGAASPGRGSEQNSSRVRSQGARPPARPDGGTHPSSSQRGGAARPSRAPQVARTWPASHAVLFARAYQPPASVTFFLSQQNSNQPAVCLSHNKPTPGTNQTNRVRRTGRGFCLPARQGGGDGAPTLQPPRPIHHYSKSSMLTNPRLSAKCTFVCTPPHSIRSGSVI
jgi:hypothetical protein